VVSIAAEPQGGTRLTLDLARRLGKPVLHIARANSVDMAEVGVQLRDFLREHSIKVLNVAGPRASQEPEIAAFVAEVLRFALVKEF
jgi:hypothetical protein